MCVHLHDAWASLIVQVFELAEVEAQDGSRYHMAEKGGLLEPGRPAEVRRVLQTVRR